MQVSISGLRSEKNLEIIFIICAHLWEIVAIFIDMSGQTFVWGLPGIAN